MPRSVSKRLSQLDRLRPKTRGELSRMVWQDEWDGTRDKQLAAFIRANPEKLKPMR